VDSRVKLDTLITDSRNAVFSNFFLAKPRFWRAWKSIFGRLFQLAETPGSPLHACLNATLDYRGKTITQMKVFVMERTVSFLLAGSDTFRVRNFPPFRIPVCKEFEGRIPDVVMLDSLKLAFSDTEDPEYLRLYVQLRDKILSATLLAGAKLIWGTTNQGASPKSESGSEASHGG
jgi:hypothetical protein